MLRRSRAVVRTGVVRITFAETGSPEPHVAFSIGKKVGGAVVRNRVRRRLRAISTELTSYFESGAYLISASPGVADVSYGELKTDVRKALETLHRDRCPK